MTNLTVFSKRASSLLCFLALAGQVQSFIGTVLLAKFCKKTNAQTAKEGSLETSETSPSWPAVSLLKPLCGNESLLKEALESFFQLDYPNYELIFGVHHPDDPAIDIVRTLQARYPQRKTALIIDETDHGPNRKIGNLINLSKACQHDIFVISDSDIHVDPLYLKEIIKALNTPKTQLVTTLYAGLPADKALSRLLGALSINANFLPGVMMSRFLGRQDCLGATMALKKENLQEIGGFEALVNHLADDAILGQLIRQKGGDITLAQTLCRTTITENTLPELLSHELRWGRTVRSVEPVGYALSSLQLPLFWASLAVIFNPRAKGAWAIFFLSWIMRAMTTHKIARLTKCPTPGILPYLLLRDWLSFAVMIGSARGSHVAWRGHIVRITSRKKAEQNTLTDSSLSHPYKTSLSH